MALVAEHGVRAVSFREVARRAGVSHQTPYHYFGDYRGILTEIAREGFVALGGEMHRAASGSSDPVQAIADAGTAYVDFAENNVGSFRVMFQHLPGGGARPDLVEASRTYAVLEGLSESVVAAGGGHGLTAPVLAQLCWATVHGIATLSTEGLLADKTAASAPSGVVVAALAGLLD